MSSTVPTSCPQPQLKGSKAPREAYLGPTPSDLSAKRQYLVLYNLVSLILWASLLIRVFVVVLFDASKGLVLFGIDSSKGSTSSVGNIYPTSGNFLKWIQTLAIAEVVHSLVRLVRAPVMTTAMQVASRLLLVWAVMMPFGELLFRQGIMIDPKSTQRNQLALFGMILAWGVTECIRYTYFVFSIASGKVPSPLSWLRYNTFYVLYPLGISCECWLVYKSIPLANQLDWKYGTFLGAALLTYVPGSVILYSHMMAQRKRIMKGKQKDRSE